METSAAAKGKYGIDAPGVIRNLGISLLRVMYHFGILFLL